MDISFTDCRLRFATGVQVIFDFTIVAALPDHDRIYIVLDAPPNKDGKIDNVICVGLDGSFIWQIEAAFWADNGNGYLTGVKEPDGSIKFWCYDGFWVWVDRLTGKIIRTLFAKM